MKYIFFFTRDCRPGFLSTEAESVESAREIMIQEWKHLEDKEHWTFLQPVQLSKELAEFTGWSEPRSRVDITKFICDYIKRNKLQDPEDSRVICPDIALRYLFSLEKGTKINYYSMQSYIRKHIPPFVDMRIFGSSVSPKLDDETVINDGKSYPTMLEALQKGFIQEDRTKVMYVLQN